MGTLPEGTAVAPAGDTVLRVDQDPELKAPTAIVAGPRSGAPPTRRLLAAEFGFPTWRRVSADGGWLLEKMSTIGQGDYQRAPADQPAHRRGPAVRDPAHTGA